MTDAEKERRNNDPHVQELKSLICDSEGDKSYVFISYKSDDWETVLADAVYRLATEYGLNIYYDGSFDIHAELWTEQFPKNMEDSKCRGVIAFIDDKYATSYATLLELMYSQAINDDGEFIQKKVVPVNLGTLSKINDKNDTGLGQPFDADGIRNNHANEEKKLFDRVFETAVNHNIFSSDITSSYNQHVKDGTGTFTKKLCSNMVGALLGYIKQNDNEYRRGGNLENIVHSIRDACGEEVFSEPRKISVTPRPIKTPISEKTVLNEVQGGRVVSEQDFVRPVPSDGKQGTIKIVSDGSIYHIKGRGSAYDAFYRMNEGSYTVLRGSKLRYHEKWTPKKIWEKYKDKITEEGILLCDIEHLPITTAAKLIEGTSASGKELESRENLMPEGKSYEVSYDSYRVIADTERKENQKKKKPDLVNNENTYTSQGEVSISEKTTLKEFQGYFKNMDFVYSLREVRNKCKKQLFDYLMASLLRGCDKNPGTDKAVIDRDRYNYCTYVISQTLNQEQPQIGASYYTWTSNARKALKREAMPSNYFAEDGRVKSGLLGDDINKIFEALDGNMTIGEVLQKYKSEEKGFVTKDNKSVLDAWELIKGMSSGNKGGKQGLGELIN